MRLNSCKLTLEAVNFERMRLKKAARCLLEAVAVRHLVRGALQRRSGQRAVAALGAFDSALQLCQPRVELWNSIQRSLHISYMGCHPLSRTC